MTPIDLSRAVWRKSSRSSPAGENCIEITRLHSRHAVRDSKNPGGEILTFDTATWSLFITRVKQDELDL